MEDNFSEALSIILVSEGGYVNHPRDPGGHTNLGITLNTYRRFKEGATVEDLKKIPMPHVREIYKTQYWDKVRAEELYSGLDLLVFDMAVNAGPSRSIKLLQRALKLEEDGVIGPITLEATRRFYREGNGAELLNLFSEERLKFYRGLNTWDVFGKGWENRTNKTLTKAVELWYNNPSDDTLTDRGLSSPSLMKKPPYLVIRDAIGSLFKTRK